MKLHFKLITITAAVFLLWVPMSFANASDGNPANEDGICYLDRAMSDKKKVLQDRSKEINRAGIREPTTAVVRNLPNFSEGACLSQIYDLWGPINTGVKRSAVGSIVSSLIGAVLKQGCAQISKKIDSLMETDITRLDDSLGIIRDPMVKEVFGRRAPRNVNQIIRAAKESSSIPAESGPLNRTSTTTPALAPPQNTEGLNDARNGL